MQTVVSQLNRKIVGKKITRVWSDWRKSIFPSYAEFARKIKDASVIGVRRLGKHIVIDLDNGYSIAAHLKMTGHFLVKDARNRRSPAFTQDQKNQYVHHIIAFVSGTTLEFSDMRKFGWWRVLKTSEVESLASIALLGIDALSLKLTPRHFRELLLQRKQRSVGEVLLEQNLIAGIGNIYRSEALFMAGILPTRLIKTLAPDECKKLLSATKSVLRRAMKMRGTSDSDFRDTSGLPGGFQRALYVYRRAGEVCKKCGTMILRKKLGQRSVYFCHKCQI